MFGAKLEYVLGISGCKSIQKSETVIFVTIVSAWRLQERLETEKVVLLVLNLKIIKFIRSKLMFFKHELEQVVVWDNERINLQVISI